MVYLLSKIYTIYCIIKRHNSTFSFFSSHISILSYHHSEKSSRKNEINSQKMLDIQLLCAIMKGKMKANHISFINQERKDGKNRKFLRL